MIECVIKKDGLSGRRELARLISFVIVILSTWFPAFSQTSRLDSLKALVKESTGNQKIHLLFEIAKILPDDEAADQYRSIINQTSDSIVLARAICNLGGCLYNQRLFHEAEGLVEANIPIFDKNEAAKYYVEGMYSTYAKIQMIKGNYSSAFENFYKCLALVRSRDDSLMLGSLFINIGLLYYKVRNNTKALELYSKGMNLLRNEKSIQFLGNMNSSLCLSELGFPSLALTYCDRAFALANDEEHNLLHAEFATGFALLKLGRLEEARDMFECSRKRSAALNDARMHADNLAYISKTWIAESMLDSAYHALSRAEHLASENQLKEILLDTYRGFIRIAFERKDYIQLTIYRNKYIQLKQEVYNIELERKQALLEGNRYEHENVQLIGFQQLELDEQRKAMIYQRWISITLYAISLLVVLIIVLYLRGFYLQRKCQQYLEVQVHSRVGRLKRMVLLNFENVQEARELGDVMEQCRGNLINLLRNTPHLHLEDSLVEYIERIKKNHLRGPKVHFVQSSSIRTKDEV